LWPFLVIYCQSLSDISNGNVACSLGDDRVPSYQDTCTVTCNSGYILIGSDIGICQSNGSWSGANGSCRSQDKNLGCLKVADHDNLIT